jgi:hypothetical protein
MFSPPGLGRLAQHSTAFFGTDVSPPRGTQTDSHPFDRFWREPAARDIEQFNREIEEDFRRKTRLSHDAPKSSGPPRPEEP